MAEDEAVEDGLNEFLLLRIELGDPLELKPQGLVGPPLLFIEDQVCLGPTLRQLLDASSTILPKGPP